MQPKKPEDKSMDNDTVLDHCALECMNAIENKDVSAFRESFHVLIAHILSDLESMGPEEKEEK